MSAGQSPSRPRRSNRPLRRGVPVLVALALLATWLGVRSGEHPAPGAPADGPDSGESPPAAPGPERASPTAAPPTATDAAAAEVPPRAGAPRDPGAARTSEPGRAGGEPGGAETPDAPGAGAAGGGRPPEPAPEPAGDADPAAERDAERAVFEDRFGGLERRLAAVDSTAALDLLTGLLAELPTPRAEDLAARLAALRAAAAAQLDARLASARAAARRGDVFVARDAVAELLAAPHLEAVVRAGLGIAAQDPAAALAAAGPPPAALPRGLVVERVAADGARVAGTVERADAARATLRLDDGTFPTVSRTELAFATPDAGLALAQALAAARDGRAALAWVWVERAAGLLATHRAGSQVEARVAELRERLAGR